MNNFSFYKGCKAFYCLFFLGCFLSSSFVLASNSLRQQQPNLSQKLVQGSITDGTNPLPGVTIAIKGKANSATISDHTGQYSMIAANSDTLVLAFIGFKTALVPVNNRQTINVVLQYDVMALQEVRVNAGYYTVKESERTGSISRVTSKDIEIQPVTNVLAAMQGRMAGVDITQQTGTPGGGFDIKIRGQNSLRSDANSPLYVIDGVPYSSDPIGSSQTSTPYPSFSSPLNGINPDNIESIEVLKDADATSIYGSRGANGVVLITTKKGKKGKTSFSISSSTGVGKATTFLKLMNTQDYLAMRRQAFINDGLTQYGPRDYDINGTWDQNRYTDWQREILGGTSQINDVQGSASGGSEKTQFRLGGNYHQESTIYPGDFRYKKGGAQLNVNHVSEDNKFRFAFSGGYDSQNNKLPSFDLSSVVRFIPPNGPALYNADGSLNWENGTWQNPLRNLNAEYRSKTNDLIANTVLSYEIIDNLTVKGSFGFTDLHTIETRTVPSTIYNPIFNVSSDRSVIYQNNTDRSSWIIEPQINYERTLGKGKLDVLLGGTFQNQVTSTLYQLGAGFISNSLIYNLSAAKSVLVTNNDETQYKYQAFFARANYNLQQRYILNLTARRDGSSRFGPGNQFATFGAVGAAWVFSRESYLQESQWLSFGKIRASYGTTGNDQIGDYQYLNTYSTTGVNYGGTVGIQPSRLFNPDFGWEINKKLEFALELGFLQDRIFTTASWYQNRSSNQLVGIPLPGTTGFPSIQSNLDAEVENKGLELTLRTVNFNNTDFKWSTNFNISFARNKLLRFPGLEGSTYSQQYRIGQPLNINILYQYKGVNPQTGVYEFEDYNNDGNLTIADDAKVLSNLNPKFYGGLQNQLTYKRCSLDFLFQFTKQKKRTYPLGLAGVMSNQYRKINDSWMQPGDNAPYQIFTTGYNFDAVLADYYYSTSSATVTDGSFIRLKNIAFSYNLPLLLKETNCKIIIEGQNLVTFTKYEDGDPESIPGFLPPLKVITAGVQLTF
ncbi:SusC/RagA family TonB-linked outer membrane protein [[Flexibacter] sp. ATCC 35103]|uniref:SusC/RagA family TonB-linked outer membrane protein n=1 Tax=[Flexibacter] sp. ATCC 35103 TaxID=1937528 RepID=UPI0009D27C78|nr:SusC/RagA family TonB-linked outer membrane protein [[Flexibacter] sp. ATCC 35103]OMQ11509.1 SusC/RagA family protein [[Flexibacter] sp. ATCC 35103]